MNKAKSEYIKNWLFRANEDIADFPRTHDLDFLLLECQKIDQEAFEIDFKSLTDFGVSARYPDDFYIPDIKETLEYRDIALEIKEIVEKRLKI